MERLRDNTRGFLITSNGLPNEFTLADAAPHNVLSGTTSADADYDGLHIGGFLPALSKTGANPILHFSSFAHKPSAYSSMNPSTSPSPSIIAWPSTDTAYSKLNRHILYSSYIFSHPFSSSGIAPRTLRHTAEYIQLRCGLRPCSAWPDQLPSPLLYGSGRRWIPRSYRCQAQALLVKLTFAEAGQRRPSIAAWWV